MALINFTGTTYFHLDATELPPDALTLLCDMASPGDQSANVAEFRKWFDVEGEPVSCRNFLRGVGAWEEDELDDHDANLDRLIWLTGCMLAEEGEAYFDATLEMV